MVQIKFIRQGSNSMLGGFSSGDLARVSEAMAAHLVDVAMVAEYAEQPAATMPASETQAPADKPRRTRRAK